MYLQSIVKFVLTISLIVSFSEAKLGDHITICKSKDPKLGECLISSGHELIAKLQNGIPEFEIPPVDPMYVPHLALKPVGNKNSPVSMGLILINSTHRGLASTKITKAVAKPENYEFIFHAKLPSYSIVGKYDVKGKIMLLPINGKGDSNITLYNVDTTWTIKGEPETRDGEKYFKLKSFVVTIAPKDMKVHFDNLFQGNQVLGETMNTMLNANWVEIYKQLKPGLEEAYGKIMSDFGEKIFSKTPYNQIFSDL